MNFSRLIAPYARKILLMIARGSVAAINNTGTTKMTPGVNPQRLQLSVMADETMTDVERWQEYGLETFPPVAAEALLAFIDGNRSNGNVVCVQDKSTRPTDLTAGDVCLYNSDDLRIVLRGTKVLVSNSSGGVVVETGDLTTETGDVIAGPNAISLIDHFHLGNLGVNTGPPVVGVGTPGPASPATTNAAGNIIDGTPKNLSTHTHSQGNDSDGDSQSNTSQPL